MRVSELYPDNPLRGRPVYIVGSGPSLDVFPRDYLRDKVCVLLNDTHRYVEGGPVVFSNNRKFIKDAAHPIRVVKGRLKYDPHPERTDNHVSWKDPRHYVFSYRQPPWDKRSHFDWSTLWAEPDFYWNEPGGTVSIFAVQFALLCGAKDIHLVGCDCSANVAKYLTGKEHRISRVHQDHDAYARGLLRLFREARERFGVPILSVNPWPGYGREKDQHREMREWTK